MSYSGWVSDCQVVKNIDMLSVAELGKHVTIARKDRDSDNWFIGSVTDASAPAMSFRILLRIPPSTTCSTTFGEERKGRKYGPGALRKALGDH